MVSRWRQEGVVELPAGMEPLRHRGLELVDQFDLPGVHTVAWSSDGRSVAGVSDQVIVWSSTDGQWSKQTGPSAGTRAPVAWHPSRRLLALATSAGVLLWDLDLGHTRRFFPGGIPVALAWSPDGNLLALSHASGRLALRDVATDSHGVSTRILEETLHGPVCWLGDGQTLVVGGDNGRVVVVAAGDRLNPVRWLHGHNGPVYDLAPSPDGRTIAAASGDGTVRVWDLLAGKQTTVLEGHAGIVECVRFSPDGEFLASGSLDGTTRLWRSRDWACVSIRPRTIRDRNGLDFHPNEPLLVATDHDRIDCYRIDLDLLRAVAAQPDARRYVNAKVVLVGDTGVGKSGLGLVLSGQPYRPTDSTHGRTVWTFDAREVERPCGGRENREVLLWDLAGQPGYRLVHQLHLNEVAVALVVFDARSETEPFSGVKHWVRALAQARRVDGAAAPVRTFLVAARVDRGGVGVSRERLQATVRELGFDGFFETSALEGLRVADLAQAIRDSIAWEALPAVSSSALFESIKQFLLDEKQAGRRLATLDDLYRGYVRAHPTDDDLRPSFETCVSRVEARGLIRRLRFGDYVLLQPELLDAYASALVQTAKAEPDGLGLIAEEDALAGRFRIPASERLDDRVLEKLLLIATVEELLRHEVVLKEPTDRGVDLVFPAQFTRERPVAPKVPGRRATFAFEGSLENVYATLAVRLAHSRLFRRREMWHNAATFDAVAGGVCGITLRELEEGRGELAVFFDGGAEPAVQRQFEAYVAEHLELRALPGTVSRRPIRACTGCGYELDDELVKRKLDRGARSMRCPDCEAADVALTDEPAPRPGVPDSGVAEMHRSADVKRDRDVAATRLRGKIETSDFDVFLSYNSRDRERVSAIAERLRERGLLPWLDVWEIPPGARWQPVLQRRLRSIRSAAVFIGPAGTGPWQDIEVEKLLQRFAKSRRPLIPVILEGREGKPRLPGFLDLWQVVDMRQPIPEPFEQLVWGITGEKPPR
jgi:GTPase SAR1 family protein